MQKTWKYFLILGALAAIVAQPYLTRVIADDSERRGKTVPARPVIEADQFELTIVADKDVYTVGEKPRITATLTNNSKQSVMLVRSLDGSDMGRYPRFQWTVTAPSDALPLQQLGRCGNTNPIMPGDFVSLAPGDQLDLAASWSGVPWNELDRGPGTYALQAVYSTDSDDVNQWIGGPLVDDDRNAKVREIGPLYSRVPRVTVTSNVIKVRFDALADRQDSK